MWAPYDKQTGFTIVELLIVIVVIGILAAISIVAYTGIQARAADSVVQSDLATGKKKIDIYIATNAVAPNGSSSLVTLDYKVSKASYAITAVTDSNMVYCFNATNRAIYALVALSKSGNAFYISETNVVTAYPATLPTDPTVICNTLSASLTSNFRGYASNDTVTGPWRSWVGGN